MSKSLIMATQARGQNRRDFRELCDLRIEAGSKELNYTGLDIRESLARMHIGLSRKVLAGLAIWEPRTFRSIAAICAHKEAQPVEEGGLGRPEAGPGTKVIPRGHL
jgi:large subunit ribosomal protein L20